MCNFCPVKSKYLGYDIATASKKCQSNKNMSPAELIPYDILDMIEDITFRSNPDRKATLGLAVDIYGKLMDQSANGAMIEKKKV